MIYQNHFYPEQNSGGALRGNASTDPKLLIHAINSISECISITDMDDVIIYVNKAFASTYGFTFNELIGKSIDIVRSDKNDPALIAEIRPSTMKYGWRGTLWNKKKDGSEFLISLYTTILKDEQGNQIAKLGVARDLTREIKAEEVLKDIQDRYSSLFLELKDAVYESTPEGKLIELNPSGMELLGIKSSEDLQHLNIAPNFYLHEKEREKFKKELEKNGYVKDYEINIKKLSGEIITVLETSLAVKNSKGKIIAFRGILRDITEQKKNEARLKQLIGKLEFVNNQLKKSEEELKALNASKDKFFSIIAHDLRSPFTSLLSFSEFLSEDINELSQDDIKSFADKIHESAKNVFELLENLLQWSRIQTGKMPYEPVSFNIHQKINQTIQLLSNNAENKKIQIINYTVPTSVIFADEDMIFSVIQNLLSNAIKFTREGGAIIFRSNLKENELEISITDNGVGIKEEDLANLFKLDTHFSTYGTKDEKGSGLGLLLCKEMIERNHGKIWVESKLNEGTTFTLTFPKA